MNAVLAPAAPCLRDVLAEALWLAHRWHLEPTFEDSAKAALYERLYNAAVKAPTDEAAWDLIVSALAGGTAELGDLTAGSLEDLAAAAAEGGAR